MRTQTFGTIRVDKVVELDRLALEPRWLIGNATPEGIAEERHWLGDALVEPHTDKLILSIHSYVVRTARLTILVDTCCGNGRQRGPDSPFHDLKTDYLANLRAVGLTPEAIDLVFCTHLHADHVGWNVMERDGRFVPTFPNARYLFNKADFEHRLDFDRREQGTYATRTAFRECVLPLAEQGRVTFVDAGHRIECELDHDLTIESLPGHCPGHSGLRIRNRGQTALFTGDAIHHPIQLPRPDWYCTADIDAAQSSETRRAIIETCADRDVLLMTAHFARSTAGRVVSRKGAVRFAFSDEA